jgi:hypothetical protein
VVTSAGRVEVPFTLTAPLPACGRFQRVGSDDVIYRIMPDRFANGDTLENLRRARVTDRPNPSKHPG